jgi:hypothetical protein
MAELVQEKIPAFDFYKLREVSGRRALEVFKAPTA